MAELNAPPAIVLPTPERPLIIVADRYGNMRLDTAFSEAIEALGIWNYPPRIFQKGGSLVVVKKDDRGRYKIDSISKGYLKELLSEAAYWAIERCTKNGAVVRSSCYPHDSVVSSVMDANAEWVGIPFLKGLTNTPIPRADGTFNASYGYDRETGYYFTEGLAFPNIPMEPTKEDAKEAARYLLDDLFNDFPFKCEASKANMLAALISPVLRPIAGRSPLFVITKPMPGEGSGLLVDLVSLVLAGNLAPVQDANCDDKNEMRKALISLLRSGTELTNFDNLSQNSKFDSPVMAGFLTSDIYRDRLLGQSRILDLDNTLCTFLTGRNVKLVVTFHVDLY